MNVSRHHSLMYIRVLVVNDQQVRFSKDFHYSDPAANGKTVSAKKSVCYSTYATANTAMDF